ncbi:cardiolipin synthase [Lysobacter sp. A286]
MIDVLTGLWRELLTIEHLKLWLAVGWASYVVWLGLWIVLQKRGPAATLSWLISLAALPYLGFLIYYFFGPQKIQRHRLRRVRAHAALPPPPPGQSLDPDAIELARLAQSTTGIPPTTATSAELLIDGAQTYSQLLAAIAQAREHVHLEYYVYLPDRTGKALRDALIERARAGVKVRLLLDAVGSGRVSRRFLKPLLDAGGEFCWFHPMRLRWFWKRPWLNLRTHRKIVIIDGRTAFTGGINITDEQDEQLHPNAYRDLHVRLEGNVVRSLQLVFVEDWAYATGAAPLTLDHPPPQRGGISAQTLVSGPDSSWEAIHRLHVAAIHSATTRVWLMTPYFVPGEAAMMALTSAALGGLDVRLVLPKMSDSWLVTHAARSYFDDLLAAGVQIYEYGPRLLHSKALVCDEDLVIVGSANFDHRSFRLNFEVSVLFRNRPLAQQLAQLVEHECGNSLRVRDDRERPLWRNRLPEALARLVSPLL